MKMNINPSDFRVPAGERVDLSTWPTHVKRVYTSKKHYHKLLRAQVEDLSALQRLHYASNHYPMLLIFQGMDAAGKDGAIRQYLGMSSPPITKRMPG